MAVRFYEVAKWLFVSAMVRSGLQRVTFPGFPEHSRGRIGVKATHTMSKDSHRQAEPLRNSVKLA
jgi:hypothetical protein